ncbi:MAG: DMT family transporter [Sulfurifustaceae bacterium]
MLNPHRVGDTETGVASARTILLRNRTASTRQENRRSLERGVWLMGVHMALILAVLSSLCFGIALVTGRIGLRTLDTLSGVAISIPTAMLIFVAVSPFVLDLKGFNLPAVLVFAAVGIFFPAVVTMITFRSNVLLGPTVTGAVSGTSPLFALVAVHLFLGEHVPTEAVVASIAVFAGVGLLSRGRHVARPGSIGWAIFWPISGALVRGLAQVAAKAGMLLWPSPFVASLIGYSLSSATVIGTRWFTQSGKPKFTKQNIFWFALTGVLNGAAVLLMYGALSVAPVSLVAPVVASYPLVTALIGSLVLKEESLTLRVTAGATLTVAAIVYLMISVRA